MQDQQVGAHPAPRSKEAYWMRKPSAVADGGLPSGVGPLIAGDPADIGGHPLIGRLGSGGMGIVYLGKDPQGGFVAVKAAYGEITDDALVHRFEAEATCLRRAPARWTVRLLADGTAHTPPYLITEYVEGRSLAHVVTEDGPLRGTSLRALATGVAQALAAIHGAGLIHRDVKPANILLTPTGPRLIDFGIAHQVGEAGGPTSPGMVVGSPGWIPPERLDRRPATPASDIFGWGSVVAFAGTGRNPFGKGDPDELAQRTMHDPPELWGLDESLRGPVTQALRKDPAGRPTAADLLAWLRWAAPVHSPAPALRPATTPVGGSTDAAVPQTGDREESPRAPLALGAAGAAGAIETAGAVGAAGALEAAGAIEAARAVGAARAFGAGVDGAAGADAFGAGAVGAAGADAFGAGAVGAGAMGTGAAGAGAVGAGAVGAGASEAGTPEAGTFGAGAVGAEARPPSAPAVLPKRRKRSVNRGRPPGHASADHPAPGRPLVPASRPTAQPGRGSGGTRDFGPGRRRRMRVTPSAPLAVIITAVAALITFLVTTGADIDGTPTTPPSGGRNGSPHPATTTLRGGPPVPPTDPQKPPHHTTAPQADEGTQSTSTKPPTGPVTAPPTAEGTPGGGGTNTGNGQNQGKGDNNSGGNGKGKPRGRLTPGG
jgi:hypothetical protein